MTETTRWWDGAVIYQIYPSSFHDSNGDGIGDLPGITARMDYIAALGVDAVWVSPFFTSPMKDFGYDVANYREVDRRYGSNADFDALLAAAHARGIRVIIDMVICHTSDEHPWFQESRQDRDNPKADWYVWRDPRPDGTEPNNWLSFFGGRAWTWSHRRQQYYLSHFLDGQPNLNYYNPEVRQAMLDTCRFWLDRGVDGFRMDAIATLMFDPELRDNPARDHDDPFRVSSLGRMPFGRQHNYSNQLIHQPATAEYLRELRALADEYDAFLLGEIGGDDGAALIREYVGPDLLHTGYSFDLLDWDGVSPERVKRVVHNTQRLLGDNEITYATGNHDMSRVVTAWGHAARAEGRGDDLAATAVALVASLPGSCCLYQGEELGLEDAELPFEALRDPFGIEFYPEFAGRDCCRTPLPWRADAPHAGFTDGTPWLPVDIAHPARAVDVQEAEPQSVLNRVRTFLTWRKAEPVMRGGARFELVDSPDHVVAGVRELDGERMLCAFNLGGSAATVRLPAGDWQSVPVAGFSGLASDGELTVPAFSAAFMRQTA